MEDLLTPVSTVYRNPKIPSNELLIEAQSPVQSLKSPLQFSTPKDALDVLRSEPDLDSLRATLNYLIHDAPLRSNFQITHPSPMSAQIINVLVSNILPNYWTALRETASTSGRTVHRHVLERKLMLSCLRSLSGLNAILARLRILVQNAKEANKTDSGQSNAEALEDHLDVLESLLHGETLISHLWKDISTAILTKQRAFWHEVVAMVGGGKLLSCAAEAASLINDASIRIKETIWIANGILYSRWLARNILHWSKGLQMVAEGLWNPFSELFSKSIRLGYPGMLVTNEPEVIALTC